MTIDQNATAFPKLDEAQIKVLSPFAKLKTFQKGETLFSAGEREYNFYIVKSGEVEILEGSTGKNLPVTVHKPGAFTGDVDMLTGRPALVSAIAGTPCEVYEISRSDLKRILTEMPRLSDILLGAFLMRRQLLEETGFAIVRVIGSRYSSDTHRIREFLAKNKVPFSWIDLETDANVDAFLAQFKITPEETPVVVCSSTGVYRNPSNTEMADSLGIRKPVDRTVYDLVVVGAGPAGLAAAVYGASEGLKTLLLDKFGPGGQAGTSSKIENYMGFPTGLSGADLANRALIQAEKFGAILSVPAEVVHLSCENGYHQLRLENGEEVSAKCILISAGVSYRKLNLEGCERFEGSGIYYAATAVEAELCRSSPVVIVGSGNSAGQAAVYLSERASQVLMLVKGDLNKSMSQYLVKRIEQTPNIQLRNGTHICKIHGDKSISGVELETTPEAAKENMACAAIFVFIGATPHTDWLSGSIQTDPSGFVKTGPQLTNIEKWPLRRQPYLLETSSPGVFAAGDIRLGSIKRVASAVGEGAMAVQFIHQYLASI